MMDIANQILENGISPEDEEVCKKSFAEGQLVALTSTKNQFGAAAMLFPDILDNFEMDLYIIPSSIHEVLVLPADYMPLDEVANMVWNVNGEHVDVMERLSNSVYFYNSEKKEVTVASAGRALSELCA